MNSDNWKECERNVQLYKELNAKHIDVERGRNTIISRNKDRLFENISQYIFEKSIFITIDNGVTAAFHVNMFSV